MDNFFEVLGPIIIGVIYLLGSVFSKKDEAEDRPPIQYQNDDFEDEDYQRLVQVEKPAKVRLKLKHPAQARQPAQVRQAVEAVPEQTYPDENFFQDEMERQMQKIEETKRRAAQLLSQSAQQGIRPADNGVGSRKVGKKRSLGSVRSSLKDPGAARSAFIYGEVLGQPVSLRESTGVPGLSS